MLERMGHGSTIPDKDSMEESGLEINANSSSILASDSFVLITESAMVATLSATTDKAPFSYLFPELQKAPSHRLLSTNETLKNLELLGATMQDAGEDPFSDSTMPAAYTYFGQFLAHDMAVSNIKDHDPDVTDSCMLAEKGLTPFSSADVARRLENHRNSGLELECVYGENSVVNGPFMKLAEIELKEGSKWPIGRDKYLFTARGKVGRLPKRIEWL